MFGDGTKIINHITSENSEHQRDFDKLHEWSNAWQIKFIARKYHVLKFEKDKIKPI